MCQKGFDMLKIGDRVLVRFAEFDESGRGYGTLVRGGKEYLCFPVGRRRGKCLDGKIWSCEVRTGVWNRNGQLHIEVRPDHEVSEANSTKRVPASNSSVSPRRRSTLVWPPRRTRE